MSFQELPIDHQLTLWRGAESLGDDPDYLARQLITCIGNKRSLLAHIERAVEKVKSRLGTPKLRIFDSFAGSGVVSRFFKQHSSHLVSNDLEAYAAVAARCFLRNRSEVDFQMLGEVISFLNAHVDGLKIEGGFIEELYSPKIETAITQHDRVFYTKDNARRLDNYRRMIDAVDPSFRDLLMGPLLSEASVHANTAGVFKGFYKDGQTKIGKFGGSNGDALMRILGEIKIERPILSKFECQVDVHQRNANDLVKELPAFDLAYFDPPYNQHPYGSNYFMLNLLVDYRRPQQLSRVSGIPDDWQRSDYNVRARCLPRLTELISSVDARFLLVSFNNEGFISRQEMEQMLASLGRLEIIDIPYNAFRGSRNFDKRSIHVTEHMFLVERT